MTKMFAVAKSTGSSALQKMGLTGREYSDSDNSSDEYEPVYRTEI